MRRVSTAQATFATILNNTIQARAETTDHHSGPGASCWPANGPRTKKATANQLGLKIGSSAFDGGQQHVIKARDELRNLWGNGFAI